MQLVSMLVQGIEAAKAASGRVNQQQLTWDKDDCSNNMEVLDYGKKVQYIVQDVHKMYPMYNILNIPKTPRPTEVWVKFLLNIVLYS